MKPHIELSESAERPYGAIRFLLAGTAPPFRSSQFVVEPGRATSVDRHAVEEMWIVLSGTGTLLFEGTACPISPGDIIHFDSFQTHQVLNDGEGELVIISLWWRHAQ
jgi:mannose-6-phosphate isomerase-like protein (cupin superfamily)